MKITADTLVWTISLGALLFTRGRIYAIFACTTAVAVSAAAKHESGGFFRTTVASRMSLSCFVVSRDDRFQQRRGYNDKNRKSPCNKIGRSHWGLFFAPRVVDDPTIFRMDAPQHQLRLVQCPHLSLLARMIGTNHHAPTTTTILFSSWPKYGRGGGGSSSSNSMNSAGPPPAYNGNEMAAKVFQDPYFYASPELACAAKNLRSDVLGHNHMTIDDLHYKVMSERNGDFESLALQLGAHPYRVEAYFDSVDIGTKQSIAEKALQKIYSCTFHTCTIQLGDSLSPLLKTVLPVDERMIKLDSLDALRLGKANDILIPKSIYVRDCMRTIFGLFQEDICNKKKPVSQATALLGSAGVGKSVLCFMAALYCAQSIPVVYYRHTTDPKENTSVFMMTPEPNGSVRIWFTRNIDKEALENGLSRISQDLQRKLGIRRKDYYAFVDGPKKEGSGYTSDLLKGEYDYCCPSGGFPLYKSEEDDKRRWVLDGWTEQESIEAFAGELTSIGSGDIPEVNNALNYQKAKAVYMICGGNIQKMRVAWNNEKKMQDELDIFLSELDANSTKLAIVSPLIGNPKTNLDQVRTMFARAQGLEPGDTWKRSMWAMQVVDSRYILLNLLDRVSVSKMFYAYNLARKFGLESIEDLYFEFMVHQSVIEYEHSKPAISGKDDSFNAWEVCLSTGTDGVDQLVRSNMYWIPSISNFASIDAAIVMNNTLHAFQMTTKNRQEFNGTSFHVNLVDGLRMKQAFAQLNQRVHVYFVVPAGTQFQLPEPVEDIIFSIHQVSTTYEEAVVGTVHELLDRLGHEGRINATQ